MIVKLKAVKDVEKTLKTILATPLSDLKLSYRVSKILGQIKPHLEKIDDQGNALVRKHGSHDLSTGRYNVAPDKMEEFTKDFVEFLEDPAEINIDPIPFEMLEKTGIKLSPDDMLALDPFIESPTE